MFSTLIHFGVLVLIRFGDSTSAFHHGHSKYSRERKALKVQVQQLSNTVASLTNQLSECNRLRHELSKRKAILEEKGVGER